MGKRELTDLRRPRPGERSTTVGLRDGVHLGLAAIFDDQQTDTVTGRVQVTNRKERWNRCRLHAEQALRNVCHAAERPAESGSAFQAREGHADFDPGSGRRNRQLDIAHGSDSAVRMDQDVEVVWPDMYPS